MHAVTLWGSCTPSVTSNFGLPCLPTHTSICYTITSIVFVSSPQQIHHLFRPQTYRDSPQNRHKLSPISRTRQCCLNLECHRYCTITTPVVPPPEIDSSQRDLSITTSPVVPHYPCYLRRRHFLLAIIALTTAHLSHFPVKRYQSGPHDTHHYDLHHRPLILNICPPVA